MIMKLLSCRPTGLSQCARQHRGTIVQITEEWKKEMHEKPKLSMMELIAECGVESSCAVLKSKAERRMMLKLRGGTNLQLKTSQIKMGRWHGVKREERVCKECYCSVLRGIISDNHFWQRQTRTKPF